MGIQGRISELSAAHIWPVSSQLRGCSLYFWNQQQPGLYNRCQKHSLAQVWQANTSPHIATFPPGGKISPSRVTGHAHSSWVLSQVKNKPTSQGKEKVCCYRSQQDKCQQHYTRGCQTGTLRTLCCVIPCQCNVNRREVGAGLWWR